MTKPKPGGWLTPAEQKELARLAAGRVALEIGAWQGLSTTCLASTAARVVSIDHFSGDAFTEAVTGPRNWRQQLPAYLEAIDPPPPDNHAHPFVGDFRQLLPLLSPYRFDMVFYDADHAPAPVPTKWPPIITPPAAVGQSPCTTTSPITRNTPRPAQRSTTGPFIA